MGGRGSGRTGGNATVERTDSIKLSIHDVMRGFDGATALFKVWVPGQDDRGELSIIVKPRGHESAEAFLTFNIQQFSRETGNQVQRIDLGWSGAHYGGKRWWWYCPRTGKRVTKLYLPNGGNHLWSRGAYRLDYQSQRETTIERAERKGFDRPALGTRQAGCSTQLHQARYPLQANCPALGRPGAI